MIARIFVLLVLMIILSDIYIDRRLLRRKTRYLWWQRLLWWTPGIILFVYTLVLTFSRDFAPERIELLNVYLFLFGVLAIPKFILPYARCSAGDIAAIITQRTTGATLSDCCWP